MPSQIADTRTLQLQINASAELLIRNLKQADNAVAAFAGQTNSRLSLIDRSFARAGTGLKGILGTLAAAASVGTLLNLAKEGLEYASSLNEVSQQIGITSRDLQVLRYAGSQVGISQEEMDKGLQRFTRTLSSARAGNAQAIGTFHALGASMTEIKTASPYDMLLKTADGLHQLKDGTARALPEVSLLGKAGQQLDTLLSGGSAAIIKLAASAEDLGLVLSNDQIENADRTADKLSELKQVLEANIAGAVANNASAIYDFVVAIEKLVSKLPEAVAKLREFREYIRIAAARGDLATSSFSLDPSGNQRDARARIAEGQQNLRQIAIDRSKASGLARGSRDSLDRIIGANKSGGKDYTEPAAAAAAAREAKAAAERAAADRKREIERRKQVEDQIAALDDRGLDARAQLTDDVIEQAQIEREKLKRDTANQLRDLSDQQAAGKVKPSEAPAYRAAIERNAALQADVINRKENLALQEQEARIADAALGYQRDILSAQSSLATSASERRDIELRLLAADKAAEKKRLEAIANDPGHHSVDDVTNAKAGLRTIDRRYDLAGQQVKQQTASPLEAYQRQLQEAVGDTNEALEGLQVDAFRGLEDGLEGFITGTETAAQAAKKMATSIIADLARIGIEQALLGAIGGGSGGGLFSSLFGGKRAAGGPVSAGLTYLVGERGPELFAPGASGSIIPNHALRSPSLGNLSGRGGGGRVEHSIRIEPSPMFDAHVDTRVVGGVMQLSPYIIDGAKSATMKAAARPGLPRGAG